MRTAAPNIPAIEDAFKRVARAELQPEIPTFVNALLGIWALSMREDKAWGDQQVQAARREFRQAGGGVVYGVAPPAQSKGTINALKDLQKFEERVLELWQLRADMCKESAGAIVNMNENYNRHHGKNSAINDRLKELASIAVSARMMMESAQTTRAKRGPKTSHVARNVSDHLAQEYHKLTGKRPTKSNDFATLLPRVFEALGVKVTSVDSYAKTAVERYRKGKRVGSIMGIEIL